MLKGVVTLPEAVPDPTALSPEELRRYSRHLLIPEVGEEGQRRLKAARVLLVGAGGLGSPAGLYLAAAGVGTLGLVDFDRVDLTNLQRQILYGQSDVGRPKLEAAVERLREINPWIEFEAHDLRLDRSNALDLIGGYDLVVDGSDNFPTRYLVNDACVLAGKPDVYGSIFRFEGQVSVFWGAHGPCYRCLFAEPPPPGLVPSCAEGGVLGVLPGIIGSLQASEALKLVLEVGQPAVGRFLLFDALRLELRELTLKKDPECPVCGPEPRITELIDYEAFCGLAAPPDEAVAAGEPPLEIPTAEAAALAASADPLLVDVREPAELLLCGLEGAVNIPLRELPERAGELPEDRELVVYCHHGSRSLHAVRFLRQRGFERARSLAGGIEAWSLEIDPTVPRY